MLDKTNPITLRGNTMLQTLVSFYLQGLLIAVILVLVLAVAYLLKRFYQKADKTVRERQETLYDVLMMSMLTIPILSFAFMALLLVLKS